MFPFQKKEKNIDFSNESAQKAFTESTKEGKSLLQKELDVNQAEQTLLIKRIDLMKQLINDIPASDPQYSMLAIQVQMDQLELDELKVQQSLLIEKISEA